MLNFPVDMKKRIRSFSLDPDVEDFIVNKFSRGEFSIWLNDKLRKAFKIKNEKKEEEYSFPPL